MGRHRGSSSVAAVPSRRANATPPQRRGSSGLTIRLTMSEGGVVPAHRCRRVLVRASGPEKSAATASESDDGKAKGEGEAQEEKLYPSSTGMLNARWAGADAGSAGSGALEPLPLAASALSLEHKLKATAVVGEVLKMALRDALPVVAIMTTASAAAQALNLSGRGLHSFTLELNFSNSRTRSGLSWVTRWTEELKLS